MWHIEADLGMHAARYVQYLDDLAKCGQSEALSNADLPETQKSDLRLRSERRKVLWMKDHGRQGVQWPLFLFVIFTPILWFAYAAVLFLT
jgi:hypothetical protein